MTKKTSNISFTERKKMRRLKRFLTLNLLCFLAFLIGGCASVKVRTDYDPEFDFKNIQTYRWAAENENHPDDALSRNPLVRKRIMNSVDKVMKAKGFNKLESGEADLVVLIHVGIKERMQVHHTGGYSGRYYRGWYDPWWGPYGGTTYVSYYEEGTLVIDLVCWEKKELAWRGMGTGTIREYRDSMEQQQYFDKIVAKILESFPPD